MAVLMRTSTFLGMVRRRPAALLIPAALLLLAAWEIGSRVGVIDPETWSSPVAVATAIGKDFLEPATPPGVGDSGAQMRLGVHVLYTLNRFAIGFGIAALIGVAIGFMCGVSRTLDPVGRPVVDMLRGLPSAAMWPLCVLVWGLNLRSQVFVIAFGATWPILISTRDGVAGLDQEVHDALGFMKMEWFRRYWAIFWWASWGVFSGLEIGCGVALLLTVTTEILMPSGNGIGWYVEFHRQPYPDRNRVIGGLVVIAVVALLLNTGLRWLKKRLVYWKYPAGPGYQQRRWGKGKSAQRLLEMLKCNAEQKKRAVLQAIRVTDEIQRQYGLAEVRPTILYQGKPYMSPREVSSRLKVPQMDDRVIQRDITIQVPSADGSKPQTVLFARSWIVPDRLSHTSVQMLHERQLTIGAIVFRAEENARNEDLGYRDQFSERFAVVFGVDEGVIHVIQRGRILWVRDRPAILIHEFVRIGNE